MISVLSIDGFEWDVGNAEKNFNKHNVTRKEIEEVFFSQDVFIFSDLKHSLFEKRQIAFGRTIEGRLLTVAFTIRKKAGRTLLRPISARPMHRKERSLYEEATSKNKG